MCQNKTTLRGGFLKLNRMQNKKEIKIELLQYFEDINDIRDLETCTFFLSYSNRSFFKLIGFPKRIYRRYVLILNYGSIRKKTTIPYRNKNTIKSLLSGLYRSE